MELCFEFLKFQSCSTQYRFGHQCPYAHSLYEQQVFKANNKHLLKPFTVKVNTDRIVHPDERVSSEEDQLLERVPDKS